jgi:cell division protein ZapA
MAEVRLSIAGREYAVACKDGEEARLTTLGAMVDEKAREAGASGGLNETRLLLFSALLLADKLHDSASGGQPASVASSTDTPSSHAIDALEALASRLENLALRLEN